MGGRDTFYPLCPCKGKIQRPERALPQNRCLRKILVLVKSTNGGGSLWTKTYDGPGQPCKAGWQPPALGRWYCQAPTGWLHPRTGWLPIPATTLSPLLHHSSGVAAPFTLVAKGPRPAFSTTFTSSSSRTTYSAKVQKKRRYFAKFVRQEIWSAKGSNPLF